VISVLSFGGGVNSTALLVGLCGRSQAPSLVLFADTGSELPETGELPCGCHDQTEEEA